MVFGLCLQKWLHIINPLYICLDCCLSPVKSCFEVNHFVVMWQLNAKSETDSKPKNVYYMVCAYESIIPPRQNEKSMYCHISGLTALICCKLVHLFSPSVRLASSCTLQGLNELLSYLDCWPFHFLLNCMSSYSRLGSAWQPNRMLHSISNVFVFLTLRKSFFIYRNY